DLHDSENHLEPVDGAARDDEHSVSRCDALLAERQRPHGSAFRDLEEGSRLDDAFPSEEGQRPPLGIARERLDDVTGEVEPIGNLPPALDERWLERELERRAGQLDRAGLAPADAKSFHGPTIIDPKGGEAKPSFSASPKSACLRILDAGTIPEARAAKPRAVAATALPLSGAKIPEARTTARSAGRGDCHT